MSDDFPDFPELNPIDDVETLYSNYGYYFELKRDGTAGMAKFDYDKVKIIGRGIKQDGSISVYTHRFPEIVEALQTLELPNSLIVGEICVFDSEKKDRELFRLLQKRANREKDIEEYAEQFPAKFMLFDMVELGGKSYVNKPYVERRSILREVLEDAEYDKNVIGIIPRKANAKSKKALWEKVIDEQREGIVIKPRMGKYGNKGYKYKHTKTDEVWIDGCVPGTGRLERLGYRGNMKVFGALHMYQIIDGEKTYVGKVGSGFSDECRINITQMMRKRPKSVPIVIEIKFDDITEDNKFRHGRFMRLRLDKSWKQCIRKEVL